MGSLIMPNMKVYGGTFTNLSSLILPYGAFGGTGTGGVGTYGLANSPVSNSTGTLVFQTNGQLTTSGLTIQELTIGTDFSGTDPNTSLPITVQLTGFGTATGFNGTWQTNFNQSGTGSETLTFTPSTFGGLWTAGNPGLIFAAPVFYHALVGVAGTLPGGSQSFNLTARAQSTIGDFFQGIGTSDTTAGLGGSSGGWTRDTRGRRGSMDA